MQNPEQPAVTETFRKRLTQNDVEKVFEDEGNQIWLDVVDSAGNAWVFLGSFVASIATSENGLSVGPVSWSRLVREKALKADDEIVLVAQSTLNSDGQAIWTMFNVEVKRKIKLLGQDVWAVI